jgi:phosphate-selective porin
MHIHNLARHVRKSILGLLLVAIITPLPAQAQQEASQEQNPVAEILLILKERGDISQERYDELLGRLSRQVEAPTQSAAPAGEPPREPAKAPAKENVFIAYWEDGPKLETANKDITFAIDGRLHIHFGDVVLSDDLKDAYGEIDESRAFFRRARIGLTGTFYEHWGFKAEYDFAGGDVNFADVFVEAYKLPALGTLTVGHFKEPMSVDEMTSTNNNWFIERSLPNEAFYPGRNTGVMFRNSVLKERLTYALAGLVDSGNFGDDEFDDDPIQDDDTAYILVAHLHGSPGCKARTQCTWV